MVRKQYDIIPTYPNSIHYDVVLQYITLYDTTLHCMTLHTLYDTI